MSEKTHNHTEKQPLHIFTENAYLNYSMYVIMDRALPFIGDGLKPVQRRIIFAMSELGLKNTAKYKKSARTIGDVLGKYHPHGDIACYEAMVLMAQPFSYRYPLIDGQGNWGAPDDPKSFAAMRYTESRLSKYSKILLKELELGTVKWIPNFDGTLIEPKTLPARLPNILLNGTTGIAVGMATDFPPHNIKEIGRALIALINNPKLNTKKIMNFIPGPDYPTEAEIISSKDEIEKIYQTGRGSIRTRAIWKKNNNNIIITALPHQVSGSKILEQISIQIRNKKIQNIENFRDESDHKNQTRLVIIFKKKKSDLKQIMAHLFLTTDLEKSYRVNLNMIGLNNKPAVKGLIEILKEWLLFRKNTVKNKLNYRLKKIIKRLHIIKALLIAYFNINEIINIIRNEDKPKLILLKRFNISQDQTESILELKLNQLAKLEEFKLHDEKKKLIEEKNTIQITLNSEEHLNNLIKKEIEYDIKKYGENRKSPFNLITENQKKIKNNTLKNKPITIILSKMGWIHSVNGHKANYNTINYKSGDSFHILKKGKSNKPFILFDNLGKAYCLQPKNIPLIKGNGEPITGKFSIPLGSKIEYILTSENNRKYLLYCDAGYGFICNFNNLISKNKNGKKIIILPKYSKMLKPIKIEEGKKNLLLIISKLGRMLITPISNLPNLKKGKGNKIININNTELKKNKDKIIWSRIILPESSIIFNIKKEKIKLNPKNLKKYHIKKSKKGIFLPEKIKNTKNIKDIKINNFYI